MLKWFMLTVYINPLQLRYVVILQMDKKDISSKAPRL